MKNTLIALALVKTLWDSHKKDYLDAFLPLLALLIQRHQITEIRDLRVLQKKFAEEWGLVIPYHAIASIVNRARKRGLLSRATATYYPAPRKVRDEASESRAEDRRQRIDALLTSYSSFASEAGCTLDHVQAESALIAYLRRQSSNLHLLSGSTSPLPEVRTTDQSLYLFARYANESFKSQPAHYRTLLEVWFGHALVNTLVLPERESLRGKLNKLVLYLDAPLIFNALGLSGSEAQDASLELLTDAKRNGAHLALFHHTYDEVFGILSSTMPWLNDLRGYDPSRASVTLRHFVDEGFSPSDVEEILASLPRRLEALGVRLEAAPRATENVKYQINEEMLTSVIRSLYRSVPTEFTIQRDVDSIAAIYRLRRDQLPRRITETEHVFLTANHSLAAASRRYELQYISESFFIPAAITDVFLGTIIWLESPQSFEQLNRLQLMADIQDLLEPKEGLVRRFIQVAQDLARRGQITAEEFTLLRTSQVARSLLQEITLGDPLNFSHRTPEEILHHIKESAREEERLLAKTEVGELQKKVLVEQAARFDAIAESDRLHAHATSLADRIARITSAAAFVALGMMWIGAYTLLELSTDATGWKKITALIATILLSALSVIVPVTDALSLASRLRNKISDFLVKRMLGQSQQRRIDQGSDQT